MSITDEPYYFDEESANRVVTFFERYLVHFEGKFAGKPFTLLPWQKSILRDVFGWMRKSDDTRRYRTVYIEVPRKQGKSAMCAGIALYLLCAEGEAGAQVFSVACNTQQANITFDAAKKMVEASPVLRKKLNVERWKVEHPKSQSIYKSLSGESVGSHGKNTHGLIIDEFHEWNSQSSRDLYEALATSMGARSQPLTIIITTAGSASNETMCLEMHNRALRYHRGEVIEGDDQFDDTFYSAIYAAGPDDAWDDERVWAKANPSLGHTVNIEYLRRECAKAKESPAYENSFRRLYLCQWTEQTTRWLSLDKFDECVGDIDPADYEGKPCFVGMDLSQSYDFAATMAVYALPDKWLLVPRLYIPKATARKRFQDDGTPIPQWIEQGFVIGMDTETVDYDQIEADIIDLSQQSHVLEVAYDPYNATQLVTHLERAGLATVPVHQTMLGMSSASKELERRIINKAIVIADNPALRWMFSNVEIESDRHGNIRPVKPKRKGSYAGGRVYSIDGVIASVIAINRAMLHDSAGDSGNNEPIVIAFI